MMKYLASVSLSVIALASCTSVKTLVVDIEKPPVVLLPPSVKNITLVNNALVQPQDVGHKSFIFGAEESMNRRVPNDSIDIILMETFTEEALKSNRYNTIKLYEYPTRSDNLYDEEKVLSKEQIIEIANQTDADAILTIDKIYYKTILSTLPAYEYDLDTYNRLDVAMGIEMNYYSRVGEPMKTKSIIQDTLFWVEGIAMGKIVTDPIPSREEALKYATALLSEQAYSKIEINKESVARTYYGDVKEANKQADTNQWANAVNIWIDEFEQTTNSRKKGRIANNIALGYELTDNLGNALEWIDRSIGLFSEKQETSVDIQYLNTAKEYKQSLTERFRDFRILDEITNY